MNPAPAAHRFVGRRTLLDEFRLAANRCPGTFVLTGAPGTGKTTFLDRLEHELTRHTHIVVRFGLQGFGLGALSPRSPRTARPIIQRSFDEYCDFMAGLLQRLERSRKRDAVLAQIRAAKRSPLTINARQEAPRTVIIKRASNVTITNSLNVDEIDLDATINALARSLTLDVADAIVTPTGRAATGGGRLCLLLDEFESISGDPIEHWLLDLVRSAREAFTTIAGRLPVPVLPTSIHRSLTNFTVDECATFLRNQCGEHVDAAQCVAIFSFTGGNPQALAIVAELVVRAGIDQTMHLLRFHNQSSHETPFLERLTDLVDAIVAYGLDPLPRDTVQALVVVRRFDHGLLGSLLRGPDDAGVAASDGAVHMTTDVASSDAFSFERVLRLPFVERNLGSTPELDAHRVHEFVRRPLLVDLRTYNPDRFQLLHTRALHHYRSQIEEAKASLARRDPFLVAIRYKDVVWRHLYTEWLHHLGHVAPDERFTARLLFADIYLDAFWWWGYYTPLTFCDDLLREWEAVCQDDTDHQMFRELSQFRHAFPPGWGTRETDEPIWSAVSGAMLSLREIGGLDDIDSANVDPSLRQLRAITSLFLGEAAQSGGEGQEIADRWYEDSWAMFDTQMAKDWTRFQQAEMWWDAGDHLRTARLLEGVEETTRIRRDHELLARLAAFTAAQLQARTELTRSAEYAVAAVLHAFVFHTRQAPAPDDYSVAFHKEILARATELLAAAHTTLGDSAWAHVYDTTWRLLVPLHRAIGRVPAPDASHDLVGLLPPLPQPADMNAPSGPYVRAVRWARINMRRELDRPVSPVAWLVDPAS